MLRAPFMKTTLNTIRKLIAEDKYLLDKQVFFNKKKLVLF